MDYQKLQPPLEDGDWTKHQQKLEQQQRETIPAADEIVVPHFTDGFKQVVLFNALAGALFGVGHFLGAHLCNPIKTASN